MHRKSAVILPAEHGAENRDMELQRTAHMFKRIALVSLDEEIINLEQRDHLNQEMEQATTSGFASIARLGMLSHGNTSAGRWLRAGAQATAATHAKKMRDAARLKALQRTPYPMVLARIKLLLDKLQLHKGPMASAPHSPLSRRISATGGGEAADTTAPVAIRSLSPPVKMKKTFARGTSMLPGTLGGKGKSLTTPSADEGLHEEGDHEGALQPIDKLLEELNTSFAYVSEFLKNVPEQARTKSIFWARMENYKKDQDVYLQGDEPGKFYMILTGQVDVWTHPTGHQRERTVIDVLKKGQSFGDHAILNGELRSECVTASSNCSMLTVDRDAFMDTFGPYFTQKLREAVDFLRQNIEMFQRVDEAEAKGLIRHMLLSSYKAGREWEPHQDPQIYFVKKGSLLLESHDHKFIVQEISRSMIGGNDDAPTMGDSGELSNIIIQDGRAMGTLGHEEEMRRIRKQMVPKKLLTKLGPGASFGGGASAMGSGDHQTSLKVIAETDCELYHMHVDMFLKHATPTMLNIFRSDMSFKLTYYYGRTGTISKNTVIGHLDALLQVTARPEGEERNAALAAALNSNITDMGQKSRKEQQQLAAAAQQKRKKASVKQVHNHGEYGPEVQKALAHIQDLRDGYFAHDPLIVKHMELMRQGVTPSERFWSTPSVSNSSRANAIQPLLNQVFPEGLAPLGDKLDELVERTARKTQAELAGAEIAPPDSPPSRMSLKSPPKQRMNRMQVIRDQLSRGVEGEDGSLGRSWGIHGGSPLQPLSPSGPCGRLQDLQPLDLSVSPHDVVGLALNSQPPINGSLSARGDRPGMAFLSGESPLNSPMGPRTAGKVDWFTASPFRSSVIQREEAGAAHYDDDPRASQRTTATARVGALTAAGVMWDKTQGACTPLVRQVLTFEEIAMLKRRRATSSSAADAISVSRAAAVHK